MMLTSLYILKNIHYNRNFSGLSDRARKTRGGFFFKAREVAIEYNIYLCMHVLVLWTDYF